MIRPAPSTWCHEDFSGEVATFGRGVTGVRMGDSIWGETFPYSGQPGLELVHERFSNRVGQPGKNIFRDRRMEFRIGFTKKPIENCRASLPYAGLAAIRKGRELGHFSWWWLVRTIT